MSKKLNPNKINRVDKLVTDREILTQYAEEIDPKKEEDLCKEIIYNLKTMVRENNYPYLTAPQIGYSKKIMAMNYSGDIRIYLNPVITYPKGLDLSREKCLSLGSEYLCFRNNDITVVYTSLEGKVESVQIVGASAKIFQHAVDHLNGLLLSDYAIEIDEDFDKLSDDEKAELYKEYANVVGKTCRDFDKLKETDETFKKMSDAVDFMTKLQKGEVKLTKGGSNGNNH